MTRRFPYRWVIAGILFFAYSVQYLDRVIATVLTPLFAKDIGLTTANIGTGAFLMMIFYAPAQVVSGILTDKFGAKRLLLFSIVAWSLMAGWMGLIQSRTEYFYRMALFGLLIGTEFVPSARILMRWFNKTGRARAQALLSLAWILTPAWASIVATQLAVHLGDWRPVFFISAAAGIVPLLLIKLLVFDRPEDYKHITRGELEHSYRDELEAGILKGSDFKNAQQQIMAQRRFAFMDLFKNRSYLAVVVVDIVIQIAYWGTLVWIPLYLSDTFGFKLATMGCWNSLYFVAAAVGSVASSWLSDKLFRNNRRVMIIVCFAGLIPFVLLLASLRTAAPGLLALALCGMGFFANMAWGPILAVPAEIFTPEVYGKAMGFVNCCGYIAAAFATKIFSALVIVKDGTKDYTPGWIFIAACTVVGIVAACFIKTHAPGKPGCSCA
ncbi:MAG: MFS transporter [Verrucomicrobia bacterium]|nr:MFS transporter [Verrucomicrobiota bacterium]